MPYHINKSLGGGFKYFLFAPLLGEDSQFDSLCLKWVETTNQKVFLNISKKSPGVWIVHPLIQPFFASFFLRFFSWKFLTDWGRNQTPKSRSLMNDKILQKIACTIPSLKLTPWRLKIGLPQKESSFPTTNLDQFFIPTISTKVGFPWTTAPHRVTIFVRCAEVCLGNFFIPFVWRPCRIPSNNLRTISRRSQFLAGFGDNLTWPMAKL